jgi:S-phase kinase-associated protein 1
MNNLQMEEKKEFNQINTLDNSIEQKEFFITIVSSDQFEIKDVSSYICNMSQVIKCIIENCPDMIIEGEQKKIVISNITGDILQKVLDWMKYHYNNQPQKIERPITTNDLSTIVCEWDFNYINIEIDTIIDLMNAANYLDISGLLDLCCAKMASIIKGKSPAEIRDILKITNDIDPSE